MRGWWSVGAGVGAVMGLGGLAVLLRPLSTAALAPEPAPAANYAAALNCFGRLAAADGPAVAPECGSRLLTHGERVERSVVLFHGVTNCPAQFRQFGERLHAAGANVVIPRLPENGYRDRSTSANRWLTAERMRALADASVDLAAGLGRRVTVVGISSGGVLAAWCAQFRPEVELAMPVAPALAVLRVPAWCHGPEAALLARSPDVETARLKPFRQGPGYGYHGFSTRNLGEIMRLGLAVTRAAGSRPPAAARIEVVTNEADRAVSQAAAERLVRRWRDAGAAVATYRFPAELGLPHDLIDPHQPGQRTDLVYPALYRRLGLGAA